MKSIQQRLFTSRRRFLIFGAVSAILIVTAILLIHSNTSQTATSVETPQSEIDFLNAEVQRNGTVTVMISINSPDYAALMKTTLTPDEANDTTISKARTDAAILLSNQARARLLDALAPYNVKTYVGKDWFIPGMALNVDQATLNFLENSSLVKSLSRDHVMVIPEEHMSPQPLYYTNTPVITQSGS